MFTIVAAFGGNAVCTCAMIAAAFSPMKIRRRQFAARSSGPAIRIPAGIHTTSICQSSAPVRLLIDSGRTCAAL
jgi:hypothetical protein